MGETLSDIKSNDRILQLKEYARILKDTPYALKTYLQTYDNTQKTFVPLDLFPEQIQLIHDYETYNENITRKYRQAGVSTVTAAWISKKLQLADAKSPEKVLIVANKRDTAIEMANKIRGFLDQWPDWINVGYSADKNSETRYKLNNGCEVKAVATSKDALRGYTPTILIFDEAAYIEAGEDFWAASMASLSTGGKIILISTPNGFDPIYWAIYDQAVRGENTFHITNLRWYRDPRYNKDLIWVKVTDIIHYILNRHEYNDEEIVLTDVNPENYQQVMNDGYKPFSPWFELMARKLKSDRRKIAQEIECDFLGSGDNVISHEIVDNIVKTMIKEPIEKYMNSQIWQWKEPIKGHRYIMGCLPPNEKVMTDMGLMNIEDVTLDFKLISENGKYINIINKQTYQVVNEPIFEMKLGNTFRSTTFTKEHPILISKPILKRNYKKNIETYKFNERFWDFNFNYVKMSDIEIGDWIKVPNIYKTKDNIIINDKWKINEDIRCDFELNSPLNDTDFWWFMGMWLGDGWLEKNNYSFSILICFDKKHKDYAEKCKDIIKRLFNRSPSFTENDSTLELSFNSKFLYYFILENFGQYSHGKKISEWIKFISNENKKELIRGYFDSDGCWVKIRKEKKQYSKISFVSINLELLESIQDILFSMGIISCLSKLRDENFDVEICGKKCNTKKAYNLSLSNYDSLDLINILYNPDDIKLNKFNINEFNNVNKHVISSCHFSPDKEFIYFRIKSIKESKYTGNVYNFKCDTHTFMCHHITTHNCDVGRGDSEDFSSINIIDFDEREQVLEYVGKIEPDNLGMIAYKWGRMYEAFIIVDITGGMGVATSRKLQEMGYKDMFIDGINVKDVWQYNKNAIDKIPGINFNNKRVQIVATFEEQLRNSFIIHSQRLINELGTFVYINGRPDHMKGAHDDSIMSISMALYAGEISFTQLKRNEEKNKAELNAWVLSERTYEPEKVFYSYGSAMDSIGSMKTNNEFLYYQNNPMDAPKEMYQQYKWLFGGLNKRR